MLSLKFFLSGLVCLFGCSFAAGKTKTSFSSLSWGELPPLPENRGFAGMYAGTSADVLLVAGGADFPKNPPWEGGKKVWSDSIFLLQPGAKAWKKASQKLPRPLAYGVSVTYRGEVICVGGCDADRHYAYVFKLTVKGEEVVITALPALPQPVAHGCGALVGHVLYVAGGLEKAETEAASALKIFWALDLSQPVEKMQWHKLPAWPGSERFQSIAAVQDGRFFLCGGIQLALDPNGKPQRVAPYLNDAYCFTPGKNATDGTWQQIADMPRSTAASPSPAMPLADSFLIFSGADGSKSNGRPQDFPGYPCRVLTYHLSSNTWTESDDIPAEATRVTAPACSWNNTWIIPSGENGPGRRSPQVFQISPQEKNDP